MVPPSSSVDTRLVCSSLVARLLLAYSLLMLSILASSRPRSRQTRSLCVSVSVCVCDQVPPRGLPSSALRIFPASARASHRDPGSLVPSYRCILSRARSVRDGSGWYRSRHTTYGFVKHDFLPPGASSHGVVAICTSLVSGQQWTA